METQKTVPVGVDYAAGMQIQLGGDHSDDRLKQVVARAAGLGWMPACDALPVIVDDLKAHGFVPELSPLAQEALDFANLLADEEDALSLWLASESMLELRARLTPTQLRGAAFLAFRRRAILTDPRSLEPITTTVAACEILRGLEPGARVLIVAAESRQHLFADAILRLAGLQPAAAEGVRQKRRETYATGAVYTLVNPEELVRDRAQLLEGRSQVVVLDELTRIWGLTSKVLDALRRSPPPSILVLSPINPLLRPENLYGVMFLLAPIVAGPRAAWDARYLDRSEKGRTGVRFERELRTRVHPFMLTRSAQELAITPPQRVCEVRRVILTRSQKTGYDRALRSLEVLLGRPTLSILERRRVDELLCQLRELCSSTHLRDPKSNDSSKVDELRAILESEVLLGGRRVVVFCRWEESTFLVSELARQLRIEHVRYYQRLHGKRREQVLARLQDDESARVVAIADSEEVRGPLKAELVVHFDLPWEAAVLDWRRARLSPGFEELVLLAEHTLEIPQWATPFEVPLESARQLEEEEAGKPHVHAFGRDGANLERLKFLLASSVKAELPGEGAVASEAPVVEAAMEAPMPEAPVVEASMEAPMPEAPAMESSMPEASMEAPMSEAPVVEAPTPEVAMPEASMEAAMPEAPAMEAPAMESPMPEASMEAAMAEASMEAAMPEAPAMEAPMAESQAEPSKAEAAAEEAAPEASAGLESVIENMAELAEKAGGMVTGLLEQVAKAIDGQQAPSSEGVLELMERASEAVRGLMHDAKEAMAELLGEEEKETMEAAAPAASSAEPMSPQASDAGAMPSTGEGTSEAMEAEPVAASASVSVEAASASVEAAPAASQEEAAAESAPEPEPESAPEPASEPEPSRSEDAAASKLSEAPSGQEDHWSDHPDSRRSDDPLSRIEAPLKALNQTLSKVPVVGETLSTGAGILWTLVRSRLKG